MRAPLAPLNTAATWPVGDSGTVRPLARASPFGKLIVDVSGVASGVGVSDT